MRYRGLSVGRVERIELDPADTRRILVHIEVDKATPVSSKAPMIESPVVLRPIKLTQVISVMPVSSTPATMAQSLARFSNSFTA